MSTIDKNLARTAYSGINYDNIIRDVITIIQNDPNFTFDMEDFTSSNAGRMILELYAYIGDQLATRLDWYVNENYLPIATQRESVIKILKLIGYKLSLPISSNVEVSLTPKTNINGTSTLTKYTPTPNSPSFYPFSLTTQGLDGSSLNFEVINFNSDTQEFNYHEEVVLKDGVKSLTFWEGTTIVEDFIVETTNNQIFYLTNPNATKNSIQVYKVIEQDNGNSIEEKKLTYVSSFLEKDAQKAQTTEEKEDIPYTYNLENGTVSIEFAPISLIPRATKRPSLGDRIRVFYRVGGGENTNIVKKAINTTISIETDLTNNVVQVNAVNLKAATGGQNEETSEHAKEYAPLTIRAQDRTVNEEDYITIGKGYDKVYKIKTYGVKNLEAEDVYERYGEYIKPLEAWSYILCKNNGYQDLKNNEFNEFRWISQRFENRFNEKYGFSKGEFNHNLKGYDLISESDDGVFKNYFTFTLDPSDYMKAKFAKTETASSVKKFVNVENMFSDFIKYGTENDVSSIEKSFNPQRTSVDLTDYKPTDVLTFDLDNNEFSYRLTEPSSGENYIDKNVDGLNTIWGQPILPSRIQFISDLNPADAATNSQSSEDVSMTFKMKIDDSEEKTIEIPILGSSSDFPDTFRDKIAEAFNISSTRISVSVSSSEGDLPPYTTEISITNESYSSDYKHFIEITSYPEEIEFTSDKIFGGGDYTTIAYNIDDKYIMIKSPNTGKNAKITFKYNENTSEMIYCIGDFFELNNFTSDVYSYGYQKLTLIGGLNKFYFENGFPDYRIEKDGNTILNNDIFFLNYLTSEKEEIEFGNYASENFTEDDPRWREQATRIYNTIYNSTDIDYMKTSPFIKFSYENQDIISLYQNDINEITYGGNSKLSVSTSPKVSFDYSEVQSGSKIKVGIDIEGIDFSASDEENRTVFESANSDGNDNYIEIAWNDNPSSFVSLLNTALRNAYRSRKLPVFSTFAFASYNNPNVEIYTPTRSVNSNVCVKYTKDDDSEEVLIGTVNNDYCMTEKYKTVQKLELTANGVIVSKTDAEKINIGDILIYYNDVYYTVKAKNEVAEHSDQIEIVIRESDSEPEINWDNAPLIFYFTDGKLYFQKVSDNFPDLEFYVNYIADKRFVEGVYEKYSDMTEEEEIKNYLDKRKILAIENVIKQPIINTFDVSGTIYYNSRLYTEDFVKKSVSDALREEFSLNNSDFGVSIKKSQVLSVIQNLTCVQWIDLKYIRRSYDYDPETYITDNEIKCNFDEILILSDDYYEEETSIKHGIMFEYTSEN